MPLICIVSFCELFTIIGLRIFRQIHIFIKTIITEMKSTFGIRMLRKESFKTDTNSLKCYVITTVDI